MIIVGPNVGIAVVGSFVIIVGSNVGTFVVAVLVGV